MKQKYTLLMIFSSLFSIYVKGNVTVTTATGGTNRSADLAVNAAAPGYSSLGNIVIGEGANGDFGAGTNVTLILTAPSGWTFQAGAGSVSHTAGANISASSISVTNSAATITLTIGGTNKTDQLTISGIKVQATEGGNIPASGNILRTAANPGNATIAGITNG